MLRGLAYIYFLFVYHKVLSIMKNIPHLSLGKIYGKSPDYNKSLSYQIYFASPLTLHYLEVPLYLMYMFVINSILLLYIIAANYTQYYIKVQVY